MAARIPKDHPRYASLVTREHMKDALSRGLIHDTGLIAHGRGEAFDYLLGEASPPWARRVARSAAAALLSAKQPVLSCNGNVVALAAKECVAAAKATGARLEVNLFHRTEDRVRRLVRELEKAGGKHVLGPNPDARIPNLSSDRAKCHKDGIFGADVVLVPLEDGDRCEALAKMGKTVIAIDLNPLSRTAVHASITIVDELRRALLLIGSEAQTLKETTASATRLQRLAASWKNQQGLTRARLFMARQLRARRA
ncbi:MAG TPA: phosphopantothenate/pantothenate synthetase [Candidatus Thermoplasmatota archaeon]